MKGHGGDRGWDGSPLIGVDGDRPDWDAKDTGASVAATEEQFFWKASLESR